jgi:spermidine synthase
MTSFAVVDSLLTYTAFRSLAFLNTLVFILFFFSGAAALVFEVTWARSLGLVFGASHLAVTTVLSVYMGGQALGSTLLGPRADRTKRPLRLYGVLEIGIGIFAVVFIGLMKVYPYLFRPLAQLAGENIYYLTALRTTFAVAAMIIPTTLMGGTLPMLTRFVAHREGGLARQLAFLYAFNTLGAVTGSLAAGFLLLKEFGVTSSLLVAGTVSTTVGVLAIALQHHVGTIDRVPSPAMPSPVKDFHRDSGVPSDLTVRLTLLGIGISGFCALGYEVLWTRMLTLVFGTSAYSFTTMLVAFLSGIGLGSHTFGMIQKRRESAGEHKTVLVFSGTQVAIGLSALAVTVLMRDLPVMADRVQAVFVGFSISEFSGRLIASFGVAFAYMFIPAFFMGMAFPVAGMIWSAGRGQVGGAVGRVLTANTVGAILGSIVSGFVLIYHFGIERSLHMLVILNVSMGLVVAASAVAHRWLVATIPVTAILLIVVRVAFPAWGCVWDQKYFATYTNNSRSLDTPAQIRERLQNVDVLYYHEGVNETVSVIRPKGDIQTFIVNGRPEASNHPMDVQLQRTLGHLPMLLHSNPKKVFVLGTGSGMTLGATSLHPEVERIVLCEIEKGVLGVARTFEEWNSRVLDNPKLKIIFNDGRNYLATTPETFDVITSDPIHPWSGGAGYLYTREYFRSVAYRLTPGGIACQWLPLYELTVHDVKTVARTFAESFKFVMLWLTYYDAVLIGSNDPILIDEVELARRLSVPAIRGDLAPIHMGTADDLLSYFILGDSGIRSFGRGGDINTDDNLTLEFSAPASQGISGLEGRNVLALGAGRESLLPYLIPIAAGPGRRAQVEHWTRILDTGRRFDNVHSRYLLGLRKTPELKAELAYLQAHDPGYAPLRFLLEENAFMDLTETELVDATEFKVRSAQGAEGRLRISAVRQYLGRARVLVSFVDNARREIYGQRYIYGNYRIGESRPLDGEVRRYVSETFVVFRAAAGRVPPVPGVGVPAEAEVAAALRQEATRLIGRLQQ